MADIPQFTPLRGDMVQPVWFEKWERWSQGIYAISGGAAAPSSGMDISIDELTTNYGTTAADASFTIDAAHAAWPGSIYSTRLQQARLRSTRETIWL